MSLLETSVLTTIIDGTSSAMHYSFVQNAFSNSRQAMEWIVTAVIRFAGIVDVLGKGPKFTNIRSAVPSSLTVEILN